MSGASKNQCLRDWEYKTIEEVLVTQELNKLNRKCAQQANKQKKHTYSSQKWLNCESLWNRML